MSNSPVFQRITEPHSPEQMENSEIQKRLQKMHGRVTVLEQDNRDNQKRISDLEALVKSLKTEAAK